MRRKKVVPRHKSFVSSAQLLEERAEPRRAVSDRACKTRGFLVGVFFVATVETLLDDVVVGGVGERADVGVAARHGVARELESLVLLNGLHRVLPGDVRNL